MKEKPLTIRDMLDVYRATHPDLSEKDYRAAYAALVKEVLTNAGYDLFWACSKKRRDLIPVPGTRPPLKEEST